MPSLLIPTLPHDLWLLILQATLWVGEEEEEGVIYTLRSKSHESDNALAELGRSGQAARE